MLIDFRSLAYKQYWGPESGRKFWNENWPIRTASFLRKNHRSPDRPCDYPQVQVSFRGLQEDFWLGARTVHALTVPCNTFLTHWTLYLISPICIDQAKRIPLREVRQVIPFKSAYDKSSEDPRWKQNIQVFNHRVRQKLLDQTKTAHPWTDPCISFIFLLIIHFKERQQTFRMPVWKLQEGIQWERQLEDPHPVAYRFATV